MAKTLSESRRGRLVQINQTKEGYTTSFDGTKIWYRSVGKGRPIILCNGLGCSTFYFSYMEKYFKKHFQVITWDYRAHGRSDQPAIRSNHTIDSLTQDLKAVVDALNIEKAIIAGHSMGVQIVYEFYTQYSKHCEALISCFGTFGKPMDTFFNSPLSKYGFEMIYIFNHLFPKAAKFLGNMMVKNPLRIQVGGLLKMLKPYMVDKKIIEEYMNHFTRVDPIFLSRLVKDWQSYDSEEDLKNIQVPTLILGAEEDSFTPNWISKKMYHLIPKSELFVIKKGSHVALIEQPELVNLRIEKFIKESLPQRRSKKISSQAKKTPLKKTKRSSKARKRKTSS